MKLEEFMKPPPDETSGETILRAPMQATQVATGGGQKQIQLPKGTVVTLNKKLPQKKLVTFAVDGKQYVATDGDWGKSVQLK